MKRPHWPNETQFPLWLITFFLFEPWLSIAVLSGCCRMQCGRSYLTFFSLTLLAISHITPKKIHLLLLLWLEHILLIYQLLNGYWAQPSNSWHYEIWVIVDQQTLVSYTSVMECILHLEIRSQALWGKYFVCSALYLLNSHPYLPYSINILAEYLWEV